MIVMEMLMMMLPGLYETVDDNEGDYCWAMIIMYHYDDDDDADYAVGGGDDSHDDDNNDGY